MMCRGQYGYKIYDLLFSDNLSKDDITKIKKMSIDLLQKIKARIAEMDHWTDKQETRAAVDILIRDILFEEIPDSMFDHLDAYRRAIYEHYNTVRIHTSNPGGLPPIAYRMTWQPQEMAA